jgi:hypothetical protein
LGREQPSAAHAKRLAKAIWYDTADLICSIPASPKGNVQYPHHVRPYTMRDNSQRHMKVRVHPDPRVQAVVEQIRESEMVQAIDRLRLIHSPRRKTVYILCNIPLNIPVDKLVTWRELYGDSRLARALERCEEQGWDALPLASKQLTRLFTELWGTERAAENWLRKNPLMPLISIIRVWGVLNTYRPPGQTRWSRALVRHGADAGLALASVLGVPAADIRVRDCRSDGAAPWARKS